MPRDGSGVFSQVPGTAAGPALTTISSASFNTLVADLVADANVARPLVAGGTGATNATAALTNILSGLTASGLLVRTGGAAVARSLATGGANITITNGDGVAGDPTVSLTPGPLTQIGGLAPVQGDILYRNATVMTRLAKGSAGQALRMNSGATEPEWANNLQPSATISTATGTAADFPGIPAWARRVTIILSGVSLSGTDHLLVQLGTSSGIETTGYTGGSSGFNASLFNVTSTAGFPVFVGGASAGAFGIMTIIRPDASNIWIASHSSHVSGSNAAGGGAK